jgi:hypothetical protein
MKRLLFNDLYIFSVKEKKAKHIPFQVGRNVITSNKESGTKKGKSVVLKCIYHTLGADCYFEDKWNENDKVYILDFTIMDIRYRIFRYQKLFKLFLLDNNQEIFRTVYRNELATYLKELFGFGVELPSKHDNELEIAPPAFNYLLSFIDQDKIDGSHFTSFKNLTQYSDFKDKVIYYHFNIYNEEYYTIIKEIEKIEVECSDLEIEKKTNINMLEKINKAINNNEYSVSLENLQREIEQSKDEYSAIVGKLSKSKKTLISLRNKKEDMHSEIKELNLFNSNVEKDIKKMVNSECPICHQYMEDQVEERIRRYNTIDDLLYLKVELEIALNEVEHKIEKEEERYKQQLQILELFENKIKINTQEVNDILRYKGYIEIRETTVSDLGKTTLRISEAKDDLKELKRKIEKYANAKKDVNNKYYKGMLRDKYRFGLKEIDDKKLESISSVITAGGSNKPIATTIWYMNLIHLKKVFNPEAIQFPIVLDSPNNVETDDEKRHKLLEYIFEACEEGEQQIVSTLGFDETEFPQIKFAKVIELVNEKYQLLSVEDYEEYKEIFIETMDEQQEK